MAKFWTCDFGANHDLGERCDCAREQEEREKKLAVWFRQGPDGQMEIGGELYVSNSRRSENRSSNYLN